MKKIISLVLAVLFLIQFTGCGRVRKSKVEKPVLDFGSLLENGFANKAQYITIEQAGIKAILYFNLSDNNFSGSLENTRKKTIDEISVEFFTEGSDTPIIFGPVSLDKSEIIKVTSDRISGRDLNWRASLVFGENVKLKKKDEEVIVRVAERIENGSMVNIEAGLMKLYEKFEIEKNKGIEFRNNIYAGRHQSYTLTMNGIVVKVQYSTDHSALIGTMQNTTDEIISRFYLRIVYDGTIESTPADISGVGAGETKQIAFPSKSWEDFEIYRPKLYFYWFEGTKQPKSEAEIKDLY